MERMRDYTFLFASGSGILALLHELTKFLCILMQALWPRYLTSVGFFLSI